MPISRNPLAPLLARWSSGQQVAPPAAAAGSSGGGEDGLPLPGGAAVGWQRVRGVLAAPGARKAVVVLWGGATGGQQGDSSALRQPAGFLGAKFAAPSLRFLPPRGLPLGASWGAAGLLAAAEVLSQEEQVEVQAGEHQT